MKWRVVCLFLIMLSLLLIAYKTHRIDPESTQIEKSASSTPQWSFEREVWLYTLVHTESRGSTTVSIIDSNGKESSGCLQFQDETFEIQSNKYFPDEAPNIYDCDYQMKLARAMISDNPANVDHWRNSVRKIGPLPK